MTGNHRALNGPLKRRTFLRALGLALAGWGIGEVAESGWKVGWQNARGQALAQPLGTPGILPQPQGVITRIDGYRQEVELQLEAVSAQVLETYQPNAIFSPLPQLSSSLGAEGAFSNLSDSNPAGLDPADLNQAELNQIKPDRAKLNQPPLNPPSPPLLLQLQWRDGTRAGARLITPLETSLEERLYVGQGVQEIVRLLPQDVVLTVALHSGLDRIERIDATSAFSSIPKIDLIAFGDRPADYIFGRVSDLTLATLGKDWSGGSGGVRYGLFTPDSQVISGTVSTREEAVKTAVQRLGTSLRSLRAIKTLKYLENQASTRLPVQLNLFDSNDGQLLAQYQVASADPSVLNLPASRPVRYQPRNWGDRPLYGLVIAYETDGDVLVGYPPDLNQGQQQAPANWEFRPYANSAQVSNPAPTWSGTDSLSLDWVLPTGNKILELFFIFSLAPLSRTLKTGVGTWGNDSQALKSLADPSSLIEALGRDLHQASRETLPNRDLDSVLSLETSAWAAVHLTLQVGS